jgi:hypothetical protein
MADPTALKLLTRSMASLGIKVPAEVDRLTGIHQAAKLPDATDALLADLDALTADNTAERLREAALDYAAQQATPQLLNRLGHRIGEGIVRAYRTDADRIVGQLHKLMAAAAPVVTEAANHFGPTDKPGTILDRGEAASAAYLALREQIPTLDLIQQVRLSLSANCGYGRNDVPAAMFIAPAPTMEALRDAGRAYRDHDGTGGRWLSLVKHGHTLKLNTADEVEAMIVQAETKAANDKAERLRPAPTVGMFSGRPV